MYTMAMDIHPSRADTSSRAQMPQKANSSAMVTISRLSVDRLCSSSFRNSPNTPPSRNTSKFTRMGVMTLPTWNEPVREANATEMAML